MKQNKNPYEILYNETSAVEELYKITVWCYKSTSFGKDAENMEHHPDGSLSLLAKDSAEIKQYRNLGHLRSDLFGSRSRELRSVLFVRLISALEVFLIDSIKYAFVKNPFILSSQQKKLELSYAKLISTSNITDLQWELAEKEARNLHSSGFRDVVKYYNSQLKINIADLGVNLSQLERFHDRRHLLVHRLGNTDHSYRHKYNETDVEIQISEQEIYELINTIRELALKLSNAVETLISNTVKSQSKEPFIGKVSFELLTERLPPILEQSYCFVSKDRYLRNSDLFKIEKLDLKSKFTLHIHCYGDDLTLIRSVLRKLQRQGVLSVENMTAIAGVRKRKSKLSFDHLLRIAQILPKRELWYQGIHKSLASALGISNGKASRIITSILEDQKLMDRLGVDVHPELKKANQIIEPARQMPCESVKV